MLGEEKQTRHVYIKAPFRHFSINYLIMMKVDRFTTSTQSVQEKVCLWEEVIKTGLRIEGETAEQLTFGEKLLLHSWSSRSSC